MSGKDPKKFDPARAHVLDAPERERYLPTDVIVALLDLQGDETVVDYGAGTGRITIPVAHLLRDGGRVVAVDSYDAAEAIAALADAGLRAVPARVELPFHFALIATPTE